MTSYADVLSPDTFAVFLFHGVLPEERHGVRNYTRKHITRERFESVLDELVDSGQPVTMDAVAAREALPPNAFAITFDDGFANNLTVAAPSLEARGVPATFYVTTGFVDANAASWIDLIEHAVEAVTTVELELPFGYRRSNDATAKTALLDEIRAYVKAGRVDPYAFAADVRRQLGANGLPSDPALDAKLDWEQLSALEAHALFRIGGHGHTHRVLEHLDDATLEDELDTSLQLLRTHLKHEVEHYSYPEGVAGCYSQRVITALQARGIRCAPTAEPGVNTVGDDLFLLRRITVV